jgi:hypothetical protein
MPTVLGVSKPKGIAVMPGWPRRRPARTARHPGISQIAEQDPQCRARHHIPQREFDRKLKGFAYQAHGQHQRGEIVEQQPATGIDVASADPPPRLATIPRGFRLHPVQRHPRQLDPGLEASEV